MKKIFTLISVLLLLLVACQPQAPPQPVMAPPQPVVQPPALVVEPSVPETKPVTTTPVIGGEENIPAEAKSELPEAPAAPAVVAKAQTVNVAISGFAFKPDTLTIKKGDTVVWTQMDNAPHTVSVSKGPEMITSGSMSKGDTFDYTFTKSGTYEYHCSIHPNMKATIVVE